MLDKIGDYKIVGELGKGGMATVYKGVQASLDRPVAIKVLSQKMTEKPDLVEHFNQEALIIAKLTHPNIIPVIDRGMINDMHYFVMSYVDGEDLAQTIKNKRLDSGRRLDIIMQVCKALSYAHRNGVTHRDIKPSNILIDSEGHAMVMDFGIAQLFDVDSGEKKGAGLKQKLAGTLDYMSPEQRTDSSKVTALSDIYSLGVTMYELFTGTLPKGQFKSPRELNSKIPERLDRVIMKCMEPNPASRYKSAEEVRDNLLGILQGSHLDAGQKSTALSGMQAIESKFALLDILKEGIHGAVYLVEKRENKQIMVIKKVKNQKSGLYEAKMLSSLKHPNIVDIYGVSGNKDIFITVMENVRGGSLKERLVKQLKWPEGLKIVRQICEGLSFAHANGIVHGNLRPSNVLMTESGDVKLMDFGLKEDYANVKKLENWYQMPYEEPTHLTDIYSLGIIMYEMLVGTAPLWRGGQLVNHYQFSLLPNPVRKLIAGMLGRKPHERYQTIDEVARHIDRLLQQYEDLQKKKEEEAETAEEEGNKGTKKGGILDVFLVFLLLMVLLGLVVYLTWDMLPYDEYLLISIEYAEELAEKLPEEAKDIIKQIKK